ncbi:hypothetical protein WJX82_003379 [Trebouxia sp. C0006]
MGSSNTPPQAVQASRSATSIATWFLLSWFGIAAKEHKAGIWALNSVLLQAKRATSLSRPQHWPAEARAAEAVVSRKKPAFGRQADRSQQ